MVFKKKTPEVAEQIKSIAYNRKELLQYSISSFIDLPTSYATPRGLVRNPPNPHLTRYEQLRGEYS